MNRALVYGKSLLMGPLGIGLLVVVPVICGLFRVWVHHTALQAGYQLSEEGHKRLELRRTAQQLEVELASLRSPAQLTAIAGKLGLSAPKPEQIRAGKIAAAAQPSGAQDGQR